MLERLLPLFSRRGLIVSGAAAAVLPIVGADVTAATVPTGANGFDFLFGRWSVAHRKLRDRLAGSTDWYEFPGLLHVKPFLGGLGNIDENELQDPAGAYLATSIRVFDPAAATWSIWWVDGRGVGLDTPVVGRFDGKVGRFYADDSYRGQPIRVRFTYEDLGPGPGSSAKRARWEQAFSIDGGATWETNWIMEFTGGAVA